MPALGTRCRLEILRQATPGLYLDGGPLGEILLPRRYVPAELDRELEVFIYRDSEDRLVATTETPLAMPGEFACLRIQEVRPSLGAFLDWGLAKDLLLPRREQVTFSREGTLVVVRVLIDKKSDRIVASERIDRWLNLTPPEYTKDQEVKILVARETPLGYSAIIENAHVGLLYRTNLANPLQPGDVLQAFVREIRPDGKIDLALDRSGFARVRPLSEQILESLRAADGRLPLHDGSTPAEIRDAFGVSKKAFKQAVGVLYRKKLIMIEADGIRLAGSGGADSQR